LAVPAGCSALRARCTASGVTPRVATMSGMYTPATIPNRAISRSGLGSVAISAGSWARCPALTCCWLCSRESVVAAGAGWTGGKIGGGATDAPTRTAPPPGPAAVAVPRAPTSGSGCRPLDPVGLWPTGVRVDQPTSARHARRNVPARLGDIEGIPAGRAMSDDRGGAARRMTTSGRLVLGACRRALVSPGPGRAQRIVAGSIELVNPFGGLRCVLGRTRKSNTAPGKSMRRGSRHDSVHNDRPVRW
jgi:hypothetical protein